MLMADAAFDEVLSLVVNGEPRSKARPRFALKNGKRVAYSDAKQREHARVLGLQLQAAMPGPWLTGAVGVGVFFARSTGHRVDIDNLVKQLFDSANRICWQDDAQVTTLFTQLSTDPNPRTTIVIGRVSQRAGVSEVFQFICGTCRKPSQARRWPSQEPPRFCSRACASLSRGEDLRRPQVCRECGAEFRRVTAAQAFCSNPCRLTALAAMHVKRRRPPSTCSGCGVTVSKPQYKTCRACWKAA